MTKQNILNVVLSVAVVVVGFFALTNESVKTVIEKIPTGAVVSSELTSNTFAFGGVREHAYRTSMAPATTTLCVFKSPASTSTLMYAGYEIFTGTSTAANIDIAKGNTPLATTTLLVTGTSVASGAKANVSWTSAGATAADDIMAPSTYVLVKTATAGLSGYTYGGTCTAKFQEF